LFTLAEGISSGQNHHLGKSFINYYYQLQIICNLYIIIFPRGSNLKKFGISGCGCVQKIPL